MTENFLKNNILELKLEGFEGPIAVSYTHLTLPTKCWV